MSHTGAEPADRDDGEDEGGERTALVNWLRSGLAAMAIILALGGGIIALLETPREEEPQIDVPVIDVFLEAPGRSAAAVARRVTWPVEQTLYGAAGVEYVYSSSVPDGAVVTARFLVGVDPLEAQVRVRNRLDRNRHRYPPSLRGYQIRPVHVDDVPFMTLTLHSERTEPAELLSLGEELLHELTAVEGVGLIFIVGGQPIEAEIELDPARLTAHGVTLEDLHAAVEGANVRMPAGTLESADRTMPLDVGSPLRDVRDLQQLVVRHPPGGGPVRLQDVATVREVPREADTYAFFADAPGDVLRRSAVTLALAKRSGSNAVTVSREVRERLEQLRRQVVPDDVTITVTRDYGQSADAAVNWLVSALLGSSLVVTVVLAATIGLREALIIAVSVPTTFALTLLVNQLAGYSLNRVTLFALIVALGLIVDDSIVSIDNIHRWLNTSAGAGRSRRAAIAAAVREVLPPMILTSLVVVAAFVPLGFVSGLMGPYMAPMALIVPVAMVSSTLVATLIVPWIAHLVLPERRGGGAGASGEADGERGEAGDGDGAADDDADAADAADGARGDGGADDDADDVSRTLRYRWYARIVGPLLDRRSHGLVLVGVTIVLFLAAAAMPVVGLIPLKLLPFEDAEELQFVIDLPEGSPVERTAAVAAELAQLALEQSEVVDATLYAGDAGPVDFNGLVRGSYLREGSHVADVRLNLVDDDRRTASNHEIALRLRPSVMAVAERTGASIAIVERPPGPPVLAPVVAEVVGTPATSHEQLIAAARAVEEAFVETSGVVDVDTTIRASAPRVIFAVDQPQAALAGLSPARVAGLVRASLDGAVLTTLHDPDRIRPRPVRLRLPPGRRTDPGVIASLPVARVPAGGGAAGIGGAGSGGAGAASGGGAFDGDVPAERVLVAGELGTFEHVEIEQHVRRKNLERVVYVTATLAGRTPISAVQDLQDRVEQLRSAGRLDRSITVRFDGEGEWFITRRVFRDLSLALGVALLGIFAMLVFQTRSHLVSLVLLSSIPLTIIGIMPGFWVLEQVLGGRVGGYRTHLHFTATAMIGIIALAGIAVRNAILLIDFMQAEQRRGRPLRAAILRAGALRVRPILLTAGTAMLAVMPIALDPVFAGLAWSLIFGLLVSTAFTLVLVPTLYAMLGGRGAAR